MYAAAKINKHKYSFLFLALIFAFGFAIILFSRAAIKESAAYSAATRYVENSLVIKEKAGLINDINLSWLDYSNVERLEVNGVKSGSAKISLTIDGEKSKFTVPVDLILDESGKWKTR